jgi:hypothetical protein
MKMRGNLRTTDWTRREALGALSVSVAAGTLLRAASAQSAFPEGAVIRTVLKDYRPEELDSGATLFHEHMSLAPDLLVRFRQYAAEAQAVNRPPNAPPSAGPAGTPPDLSFMQDLDLLAEELAIAKREGIACVVDGGHADMGRDIGRLRQLSSKAGCRSWRAGASTPSLSIPLRLYNERGSNISGACGAGGNISDWGVWRSGVMGLHDQR